MLHVERPPEENITNNHDTNITDAINYDHNPDPDLQDNADAASTTAPSDVDDGVSPEVPPTLAESEQESQVTHHKSLITLESITEDQHASYEDIHEALEPAMEAEADQELTLESEAPVEDAAMSMDMDEDIDMDVDGISAQDGIDPVVQVNSYDLSTPTDDNNPELDPAPAPALAPAMPTGSPAPALEIRASPSPAFIMNNLDLSPKPTSSQSPPPPAAPAVAVSPAAVSPRMQDEHEDERPAKRARSSYDDEPMGSTSPPPAAEAVAVLPPVIPQAPPAIPSPATDATPSAAAFPPSPLPPLRPNGPATFSAAQQKFASSIVRTLKKSKDSTPFLAPVDPVALNIPHYPSVIKHPMDFGTVERKLNASKKGDVVLGYKNAEEFAGDVKLIFENAFAFNGKVHVVSQMAERLQDTFEKQMKHMPSADEPAPPTPVSATPKAPSPAIATKPPKPVQRRPSMASSSSAIKPDPGSLNVNSRPKREIHAPTKDLHYDGGGSAKYLNGVGKRGAGRMRDDGTAEQLKFCGKILTDLYKKQYASFAYFFYDPVDASIVPTYYKVIKKPMDLSTMRKKLDAHEYADAGRFYADFQQLVKNCFTFNPEGTTVREAGAQLQRVFEEKWAALPPLDDGDDGDDDGMESEDDQSDQEREKVIRQLEQQVSTLTQSISSLKAMQVEKKKKKEHEREMRLAQRKSSLYASASSSKSAPKPRTSSISSAAGYHPKTNGTSSSSSKHHHHHSHKQQHANGKPKKKEVAAVVVQEDSAPGYDDLDSPLDNAQKKELSEAIEQLEGSKLEKVINIIQEGVPGIGNNSEEIELEIDALPAIVLTKLYNFVVRPLKHPSAAVPKSKVPKRIGSGNTGRTGAAATGGVKRKSMDEVAEAEKIRSLEEKQRLLAGGVPSAVGMNGPGMGAGADEEDSVQSESESGSESDSDSD